MVPPGEMDIKNRQTLNPGGNLQGKRMAPGDELS